MLGSRVTSAFVGVSLIALVAVSCKAPGEEARPAGEGIGSGARETGSSVPAPPPDTWRREVVAGHSLEGREIRAIVLGDGPCILLAIAVIHGDEPAGERLVRFLAEELEERPERLGDRCAVLVPVANPDGLARDQRGNARGVDINRNFPTSNRTRARAHGETGFSEPESRALGDLIAEYAPERIVSVHQPLACVDYDGPAEKLAWAMARRGPLPVRKLGARSGSLGSYAGIELGIPIVTLELPRDLDGMSDEELWREFGEMLLAAVDYPDRYPRADSRGRTEVRGCGTGAQGSPVSRWKAQSAIPVP
ncbi:MAG: M14 family zinc carboxypeptidase [Planctomycetota bacterium]